MRRATALVMVLTALAISPAGEVTAQAVPESTRVVSSTADYLDALADLSADDTGPHTIRLAADLQISEGDDRTYSGIQPLTIEGQGHTVTGEGSRSLTSLLHVSSRALVTVEDVTLRSIGGGISTNGSVVVRRSRFSGLTFAAVSGNGGSPRSLVVVSGSRFVGNIVQVRSGSGGVVQSTGRVIVDTSTFQANRSRRFAVAVSALRDVRIERSTMSGNSTRSGAIVASQEGDVTLVNTTVSGNRGLAIGNDGRGAVSAIQGTVTLDHATVTGNRMDGDRRGASAVRAHDLVARGSFIQNRVSACFIFRSTSATGSRASDRTCHLTGPNHGVVTEPRLGPLADYGGPTFTRRPQPASPLVDAITCRAAVPIDQRGLRRPGGPRCDVGAVERQ